MAITQDRMLDLLDDTERLITLITQIQQEMHLAYTSDPNPLYLNWARCLTIPRIAAYDTERAHFRVVAKANNKNMLKKRALRGLQDIEDHENGIREWGSTYRTDRPVKVRAEAQSPIGQAPGYPGYPGQNSSLPQINPVPYTQRLQAAIALVAPTVGKEDWTFAKREALYEENLAIIQNAHPDMSSDNQIALATDLSYAKTKYTPPEASEEILSPEGKLF